MLQVYGAQGCTGKAASRPLLAAALRAQWGLSPCPPLSIAPGGKPELLGHPQRHFNLSHSGPYALCALDSSPVGVDIQIIRPFRETLLNRTSSPDQRAWLQRFQDAPEAFALLWAMKESRCKYTGTGLTLPISAIRVPLPEHPSFSCGKSASLSLDGLMFTLFFGSDWQACVCAATEAGEKIHWLTPTESGSTVTAQ